jgi:hypothetical protein
VYVASVTLASRKDFPLVLLEPLKEETPLLYRKGKKRAIIGEELAQEQEQDALRQYCVALVARTV